MVSFGICLFRNIQPTKIQWFAKLIFLIMRYWWKNTVTQKNFFSSMLIVSKKYYNNCFRTTSTRVTSARVSSTWLNLPEFTSTRLSAWPARDSTKLNSCSIFPEERESLVSYLHTNNLYLFIGNFAIYTIYLTRIGKLFVSKLK